MKKTRRAFTLVEMLVAMAVMGIVMSFAALEFRDVVSTYISVGSHLSSEQQARLAMAKVSDALRQASVVDVPDPNSTASPGVAVLEPQSTPGPRLVFTAAAEVDANMPLDGNGRPTPCYNVVQIYWEPSSESPPGNLFEQIDPDDPGKGPCPNFNYGGMPRLLARNVQAFVVQPGSGDGFLQGYRVDVSIFDYDDNKLNSNAGALYHLSSVITPLVFGAAD
jgi:prepilin-type N-terminal cleavage/methylation domain-containing protein